MPGLHLKDAVSNYAGDIYLCVKSHLSGPTNEPGVGADWEQFWRLDNSYPGLYGAWIGAVLHIMYQPNSRVTLQQQQRAHDAPWQGIVEQWERFTADLPSYFSPSRLLNVSTRRTFPSTIAAQRDALAISTAERGFMFGPEFQYFQSPRRLHHGRWKQPTAREPLALDGSQMLAPAFFFNSWTRIRSRPAWTGMTDASAAAYMAMHATFDERLSVMLAASGAVSAKVPKIGPKTITPEQSHMVAGV